MELFQEMALNCNSRYVHHGAKNTDLAYFLAQWKWANHLSAEDVLILRSSLLHTDVIKHQVAAVSHTGVSAWFLWLSVSFTTVHQTSGHLSPRLTPICICFFLNKNLIAISPTEYGAGDQLIGCLNELQNMTRVIKCSNPVLSLLSSVVKKWLKSVLILIVMSGSISSALIGNLFYKVEFILPNGDRCTLRSDLWAQILNRFRVI